MNPKHSIPMYILLVAMLSVCVLYFGKEVGWFAPAAAEPSAAPSASAPAPVHSHAPVSSVADEDLPDMYRFVDNATEKLPRPNVFHDGYTVEYPWWRFTLNDVKISKDTQGMPPPHEYSLEIGRKGECITVDENGTLTGPYSYVILDITAENPNDYPIEYCMNPGRILFYKGDRDEDVVYPGNSFGHNVVIQSINLDAPWKRRAFYPMKAGEKIEYTIGYVYPDDFLEEANCHIVLTATTAGPTRWSADDKQYAWDPHTSFLNLEPMWPLFEKEEE